MEGGYRIFRTQWGWCGYVVSREGVAAITLPVDGKEQVLRWMQKQWPNISLSFSGDKTAQEQLERYFSGERVIFSFPLDFNGCSTFRRRVFLAAMAIPYGQVRSYGWLSRAIGSPASSRAVGQALGHNPFPPVVPCHRVIRGNGTLGGFSASGGELLKCRMLEMEGVKISHGRVALLKPQNI